jgi:TonB family protein
MKKPILLRAFKILILFLVSSILYGMVNQEYLFAQTVIRSNRPESFVNNEDTTNTTNIDSKSFIDGDQMPEFPGGEKALRNFLKSKTKYPKKALKKGIQGKVYVNFTVTETGKLEKIYIIRGVDPILDQEALRVIKSMPDWNPGKIWNSTYPNGKSINMSFTIPVEFKPSKTN